ncbi:MAG: acetylxylan esterase [Prevotella sp.]
MKKTTLLLFALMSLVFANAQIRGNNITVTVTPDHADWNYKVGETAKFTISVLRSGTPIENATIECETGPEMYPTSKKTMTLKNGTTKVEGKMTKPGFYRVTVDYTEKGQKYQGICTAGFSPEKLTPTATCPDDFDQFWSNTLAEARKTDLDPHRELLPERCTKDVNVYEVSYNNNAWGSRIYGILCIPVKPGKYPALLRVPGAGCRPYGGDVTTASKGAITLEIGVHGIPVTMKQEVYDRLHNGALNGYWEANLDNRDKMPYKRIFTGAIRSIDYIASLPEWDGENLGVTGSSQGGMLSLVCAALDNRVTCFGAVHAAMCDHTASLKGQPCGWPHYFYYEKTHDPVKIKNSGYFDGINFARRIKVPGWFSFGYNDVVVPPTSMWATYNTITAPKTLSLYQQTGHFWYQEQWDEWCEWLWKQLKLNK